EALAYPWSARTCSRFRSFQLSCTATPSHLTRERQTKRKSPKRRQVAALQTLPLECTLCGCAGKLAHRVAAVQFEPYPAQRYTDAMSTAEKWNLVSVEDYLAGELDSPLKHEYLRGVVYAMTGARNLHNAIATNALGALHGRLRGKRCRPFDS